MPKPRKKLSRRQHAIQHGYRSGLEEQVGAQLAEKGIAFLYEEVKVPFTQPSKDRKYSPDFILPNGLIIETKGRFETADRQKHLWIAEQHPDLDLRIVFSNSRNRISKQSRTTYGLWCDTKGFTYADKTIPDSWLKEPVNRKSIDALVLILGDKEAAKVLSFFNIL